METGVEVAFGAKVILKGRVRPRHAGAMADVLRRDPHGRVWQVVGAVRVSDAGTLRYRWPTTFEDVRKAPYLFRFRIPRHGRSNATEVEVYQHPTPPPRPQVCPFTPPDGDASLPRERHCAPVGSYMTLTREACR